MSCVIDVWLDVLCGCFYWSCVIIGVCRRRPVSSSTCVIVDLRRRRPVSSSSTCVFVDLCRRRRVPSSTCVVVDVCRRQRVSSSTCVVADVCRRRWRVSSWGISSFYMSHITQFFFWFFPHLEVRHLRFSSFYYNRYTFLYSLIVKNGPKSVNF